MASPCEVLIETNDEVLARELIEKAAAETWRIEAKFSRYRQDNIVNQINSAGGKETQVDEETARLLDFSKQCYQISDGLFDVTSGLLRKAWTFDGSDNIPSQSTIDKLLPNIGWQKTNWTPPCFSMPAGMQVDFGGIGKEYAVDKVLVDIAGNNDLAILVNFGGDLHANKPRKNAQPWFTGIDNPARPGAAFDTLQLFRGALATSGDAFRFLQKDGIRYSHVLDPRTGWPVPDAPRSVTVLAENCIEAGILSTLALLHGGDAEGFLESQDVRFWVYR